MNKIYATLEWRHKCELTDRKKSEANGITLACASVECRKKTHAFQKKNVNRDFPLSPVYTHAVSFVM